MRDEDLLQCPLLQGLDAMHRAQLIGLLNDSNLRERLEKCLADRAHSGEAAEKPPQTSPGSAQPVDFEKEVHSWNPAATLWRRSAKE